MERLACIAATFRLDLSNLFAFRSRVALAPEWNAEEAQLLATYRAIPDERRGLAVPLVAVLARTSEP